jgi:hypothetical protein
MTDQNIVAVNQIVRRVEVTTPGPAGPDTGVSKIIAGTANVTLSPTDGTGNVTVSVAGDGTGTVTSVSGGTALNVTGDATVSPTVNHDNVGPGATVTNLIQSVSTNAQGHVIAMTGASDTAAFRSSIGLKSTAITDMGTTADKVVQLDASARLPAVNGSQLTNLPAGDPTSGYTGQTSITTLGTIATGTWDGTTIAVAHGGTGSTTAPMIGVVTAADAAAAQSVLGGTTVGKAVFVAADAAAARTAIGAGTGAGDLVASNNLSDLVSDPTARTNLGLGTVAVLDVGTNGDNAVQLTGHPAGTGALPAVSGAALTALDASNVSSGNLADAYVDLRVDHGVTFDGQGSVIAASKSVLVPVERAGVITAASLVGDASGSITITVKRYTPSSGSLNSATSLGTIALSSAQHARDTTLSGWTTSLSAGDVLEFVTTATIATVTRVTCKLKVELA